MTEQARPRATASDTATPKSAEDESGGPTYKEQNMPCKDCKSEERCEKFGVCQSLKFPLKSEPKQCRPGSRCERRALGMEPCVAGECWPVDGDGVPEVLPERGNTQCNPHPDAPHGFNRNSSHSAARYVCDCEEWAPDGVGGRKP